MAAGRVASQFGITKPSWMNATWGCQVIRNRTTFRIISSLIYFPGGWLWFHHEMVSPSFPGLWLAETISAIKTFVLAQNFARTGVLKFQLVAMLLQQTLSLVQMYTSYIENPFCSSLGCCSVLDKYFESAVISGEWYEHLSLGYN